MKIRKPFSAKRILAIVLGVIVFGFMVFMLLSPGGAQDTAGEMLMIGAFMFALSLALVLYGLFGGKEPQIGMVKRSDPDEKDA